MTSPGPDKVHCPYCRAPIPDGDDDCQPLYAQFQGKQFSDWDYAAVALLSVDAHALQHPEIHGYKNNAFHLIRLCWLLEWGGDPRIGQVPRWLQAPFDGKPDVVALPRPRIVARSPSPTSCGQPTLRNTPHSCASGRGPSGRPGASTMSGLAKRSSACATATGARHESISRPRASRLPA